MSRHLLDSFDLRLLSAIQQSDTPSLQKLAEQVNLSSSQCSRRISRLKENGYIQKQVTLLNPNAIGLNVEAFVTVQLNNHTSNTANYFKQAIIKLSPVLECHAITGGDGDYLLKVVATNQQALSNFLLEELMKIPGVNQLKTAMTLSVIKSTTELPLGR
ncbi:MAG: Lrp/AsnC family transcriptional regulator [Endozoicomonas sp.]